MSDKEPQQWMRDAAKAILHAGSWPDDWEPEDAAEIAGIIAAHCPEKELGHGTEPGSDGRLQGLEEAAQMCDRWHAIYKDETAQRLADVIRKAIREKVKSGKYPIAQPSRMMISKGGEIHQECPDCRGECSPAACPRCGSGFKSVPLQVVAPEFFAGPVSTTVRVEMCTDSWHSSVATKKEDGK